jgi:hypothetical protein
MSRLIDEAKRAIDAILHARSFYPDKYRATACGDGFAEFSKLLNQRHATRLGDRGLAFVH